MPPLLEAENITKEFPGTLALDHVQLELIPGEIHAVVGENGAGKSTLMKILAGVLPPDTGEIRFEGKPVVLAAPHQALVLGIAIVHQELSLVPPLTVAENIFPGRLPTNAPATPMTYEWRGRQYVVVMAGGYSNIDTPPGDELIAFALPE